MKCILSLNITHDGDEKFCKILDGTAWRVIPYSGDLITYEGSKYHFYSREYAAPTRESHSFYIKDGDDDLEVSQQYFDNHV